MTGDDRVSPRVNRWVAGFLSTLIPGLGHLATGRLGLALLFGAPVLVLLGLAVAAVLAGDPYELGAYLADPAILSGLLVFEVVVLGWRLGAVVSSVRGPGLPPFRRRDLAPLAILLALVIVPQGLLGVVTNETRVQLDRVFAPAAGGAWEPSILPGPSVAGGALPSGSSEPVGGLASPSGAGGSEAPSGSPDPGESASGAPSTGPSASPGVPRVTILLIGMDSGVGRRTSLTDTMIVVSLDPVGRTVSMLSVPRDMVDVPLPDGRKFRPKINGLVSFVRHHPSQFPGAKGNGQAVLAAAIGTLLGIKVDYWAQVNLGGLVRLVNAVGGIDVTVTRAFCDPTYDEYGQNGFGIGAGRWHLNGSRALAYARVRKALGESDFTRAARQQEVVVGLRDAVVRGGFVRDPVRFLRALGDTIQTSVPPRVLRDYVGLARQVGRGGVYRAVIRYPLVRPGKRGDPRGSIQVPNVKGIRALAASLFPPAGTKPSGASVRAPARGTSSSPGARGSVPPRNSCHPKPRQRPAPRPTARPTPRPTTRPTAPPTAPPEPTPAP